MIELVEEPGSGLTGMLRRYPADTSSSSPKERYLYISQSRKSISEIESKQCIHRSLFEKINDNNQGMSDQLKVLENNLHDVEHNRDFLQSLLEMSSYNGTFVWKIPEIRRRTRDAIANRVTSLYSPPFYTSRQGYKMCVRAYLNGDGMGHGTHLSLFLVLMRGEYDNILKWPFEYKVTMTLINQENRLDNIVNSFQPDPKSSSFQKPTSDKNIASGCPRFATQDLLGPSGGFVVDDTIFIKCSVDTTHVPQ